MFLIIFNTIIINIQITSNSIAARKLPATSPFFVLRDVIPFADEYVSFWIGSNLHQDRFSNLKLTVTLVGKIHILKLCVQVKGTNSSLFVNLHLRKRVCSAIAVHATLQSQCVHIGTKFAN